MRGALIALLLVAAGCGDGMVEQPGGDGGASGIDAAEVEPGQPDARPGQPDLDAAAPGPDADLSQAAAVCSRWQADRADLDEGAWSGSVASCTPGDVSAGGRASALRLVNLYRALAGLPAVATDPDRDEDAQACALMMHANGDLDHDPPTNWACYSAAGAGAAGSSNISPTPGVAAIDLYMVDPGNPTTLGHRRWLLSNGLGPIGLGTTSEYSCAWVIGGSGGGGRAWTAFPPPGPFPSGAIAPTWASIDETGWSVQSDSLDLGNAEVSITQGGTDRPVAVSSLLPRYGSESAISIIPQGWTTQVGATYHVEVTGAGAPIEYDVEVIDCP